MSVAFSGPTGEFLQALGGVVVNFAGLEESLRDAIKLLADSECASEGHSVNVLTARMSFPTLIDSFGALCKDLGTARPDAGDPNEFCSLLRGLNEERNRFMHSVWNLPEPDGGLRRIKRTAKPRTGFGLNVTNTDVDSVWDLGDRLSEAERKLWEYVPL